MVQCTDSKGGFDAIKRTKDHFWGSPTRVRCRPEGTTATRIWPFDMAEWRLEPIRRLDEEVEGSKVGLATVPSQFHMATLLRPELCRQ